MCFICARMDITTQLKLYLHEQTQIVANAACRVGNQQFFSFIANYVAIRFPTLFVNPTFLLNF